MTQPTHVYVLSVTDPNGLEISVWSTLAEAEQAKTRCMQAWIDADPSATWKPGTTHFDSSAKEEPNIRRFNPATDRVEEFLNDCEIEFVLNHLKVDEEAGANLL